MSIRKKGPAVGQNGETRKKIKFAALITPEDTRATLEVQRLRVISRRASLSPTVAAIVAELAFGEMRHEN